MAENLLGVDSPYIRVVYCERRTKIFIFSYREAWLLVLLIVSKTHIDGNNVIDCVYVVEYHSSA